LNVYTDLVSDASAGDTVLSVRNASSFSGVGQVLLHQTQNYRWHNGSGNVTEGRMIYEVVDVSSVDTGANTITLSSGLTETFLSDSDGNKVNNTKTQVVSVPNYDVLTLNANVISKTWDGYSGGLIALKVMNLTGSGNVVTDGRGFRNLRSGNGAVRSEGWDGRGELDFNRGNAYGSAYSGWAYAAGGHNGSGTKQGGDSEGGISYDHVASDLTTYLTMGGAGWSDSNADAAGSMVLYLGDSSTYSGQLRAVGEYWGGAGAGGSVLVVSSQDYSGSVTVDGGHHAGWTTAADGYYYNANSLSISYDVPIELSGSDYLGTLSITDLAYDVYNLSISCVDSYSRSVSETVGGVRLLASEGDSIAPTFNETPQNVTIEYLYEPVAVDWNATDETGLSIFWINDTTNFNISESSGLMENVTTLAVGSYDVEIFVNDTSGNVNSTNFTVIVSDSIGPFSMEYVVPTSNNNTNTTNTSVEINVTIEESDLSEVVYNWDGTNYSLYDENLVLHMNFDNYTRLNDTSLYGNNGTANGDVSYTLNGKYDSAYIFDGTGDYINAGNDSSTDITCDMTLSAWVKPNTTTYGNSGGNIISRRDNNDGGYFIRHEDGGGLLFQGKGTNEFTASSGSSLSAGEWAFVTGVYNQTHAVLYIDGVEDISSAWTGCINSSFRNVHIGTSPTSSSRGFNGTIDEVMIWNRSLNVSEISQLYMSNLYKYNSTQWELYVNQTHNATANLSAGDYTYQTFAADSSSNWNSTEVRSLTVSVDLGDTVSPVVYLTSPANASTVVVPNVTLIANATDNINVSNITFYLWNVTGDLINSSVVNITGVLNESSITLPLPYAGNYSWNALVGDANGNSALNETNFTFVYTIPTAPMVENLTATPDPVGYGQLVNMTFNLTYGDVDTVLFEITYNGTATNYSPANDSTLYWLNKSYWLNGTRSLRIYANDTNGVINNSETTTFDVYIHNITFQVRTLQDIYGYSTGVNLTDPPG
jgi:hypothetical protein